MDKNKSIHYIEEIYAWHTTLSFIPAFKDIFFLVLFHILFRSKNHLLSEFAIEDLHERTNTSSKASSTSTAEDLLARWIDSTDQSPEKFLMKRRTVHCIWRIAVDSYSTANTLRAVLYELLKNHRADSAFQAEIDAKDQDGQLSNLTTYAKAKDVPYLQAASNEYMGYSLQSAPRCQGTFPKEARRFMGSGFQLAES